MVPGMLFASIYRFAAQLDQAKCDIFLEFEKVRRKLAYKFKPDLHMNNFERRFSIQCVTCFYIYIYLNRTSMWNHEIVSSKWCHKTSPPYIYTQAPSVFIIIAFYQFLNGNYCHWGTMNSFINSIIDICIFISSRGSLIIIIHFWVYSVIVETPGGLCGKQSQKLSAFYPQMVKIYK